MRKMTAFYIFAALFFAASVAINILLAEDSRIVFFGDFIAVLVAALPVITSLYVFLYFKKGNPERTVWFILVVGLVLWLLGEFLWFYYEAVMETNPFPSIADIAWILGYPSLMVALIIFYKTLKLRIKKYEAGFAALVILIGIAMFFLFGHLITGEEEFSLLEKAISLFYPVADLLLLYFALLITGLYWAGRLGYSWLLIALGMILYTGGDLWFAYLEWTEIYPELGWPPVNLLWILGDLLVFLGAVKYRLSFEELA